MDMGPGPASITVAVRRDHLVEDAFAQLNSLGSELKSGINVSFVNELGLSEAGLDYGGLFKEFLTDLAKAAFDPGYGLFAQRETDEGLLFPHPAAGKLQHGLQMLEFLGRIVGKAIYEGILLEFQFSHAFIWKLLGRYVFFDELSALDPELHQNLMYLKVSCDTTVWAMLGGQDVDRLPSASTCYNTLKLPTYKRMSTLKIKLRYAIHSNAGFELS
ncbi:hypothetical protein L7F22_020388 [Adiantum nelumboides]|nr:hypothetical protein [Adiantum nelumboides]